MSYLFTVTTIARSASEEFRYICARLHCAARFVWSVVSSRQAIAFYAAIGRAIYTALVFATAILWLTKTKIDAYVEFCEQPAAEAESIDVTAVAIDAAVSAAAIVWCTAEFVWSAAKPIVGRSIELAENALEAAVMAVLMAKMGLE